MAMKPTSSRTARDFFNSTPNRCSRRHHLELGRIDAGIDTENQLGATISDPIERRKLAREGVRTRILEL
jgi:hypothetical protein